MTDYQIVKDDPSDWKMLQHFTSSILCDCGFQATTEKVIETVRGAVEVDVYGEKKDAYNTTILCECKYWNSHVPQTIIHAFRTVVEDSGANHGVIISKIGFQKGAYEAVIKSNISLFTWKEFQDAFKMNYLQNIIDRNYKKGHELRSKATTIIEIYVKHPFVLSDEEFNNFQLSREAYSDILFYSLKEHYENIETREITMDEVKRGISSAIKDLKIEAHSLKEYFDFIYMKCMQEIGKMNLMMSLVETRIKKGKYE